MSCYTHSKRIVLLFGVLGVGLSSASEVCFDEDRVGIADCECHETCATCGFDSDPTGKKDCITCADGDDVTPFYTDGTGICGISSASEACFDGDGDGITYCWCHKTCAKCGFDSDPTGKKDCITCADGDDVKPFYADGTGTCKKKKNKDKKNKGKKSKKKKNKDKKSKKKSKK